MELSQELATARFGVVERIACGFAQYLRVIAQSMICRLAREPIRERCFG